MEDHRVERKRFINSFKAAFVGIAHALSVERHMKIHAVAALLVILFATALKVSLNDWVILLLLIALVISFELINTAIERTVDLITQDRHPLAKQAKDVAAGAVLVMAIVSAVIGICIFSKYL